jgi:hypothetical protein
VTDEKPKGIPRFQPWEDVKLSPGSCEGIYVDWSLLARGKDSDMELHIATFKTLDEDVNAYAKMGALTGYLSYASDLLIG